MKGMKPAYGHKMQEKAIGYLERNYTRWLTAKGLTRKKHAANFCVTGTEGMYRVSEYTSQDWDLHNKMDDLGAILYNLDKDYKEAMNLTPIDIKSLNRLISTKDQKIYYNRVRPSPASRCNLERIKKGELLLEMRSKGEPWLEKIRAVKEEIDKIKSILLRHSTEDLVLFALPDEGGAVA